MSVQYKNYILKPFSHQSPETNKWSTSIEISKHEENGASHYIRFDVGTIFDTQKEADDGSLFLGQTIIDGNYHEKLSF